MTVSLLTITKAFKATIFMPGLPPAERRLLAGIIEHYNRKDGRCDPGVDHLAAMLHLNRTTVLRSITSLAGRGLLSSESRAGRFRCNRYDPNFDALVDEYHRWRRRHFKGSHGVARETDDGSHSGPADGGAHAAQTCLENQFREPGAGGTLRAPASDRSTRGKVGKRLGNGSGGLASVETRDAPVASTSVRLSADEAERLVRSDIHLTYSDRPARLESILAWLPPDLTRRAVEAEMVKRRGGLRLIIPAVIAAALNGSSRGPIPPAVDSIPDDIPVTPPKSWVDDG